MKKGLFCVPSSITILLDQNIPRPVLSWLREFKPSWLVQHTDTAGLSGKSDREVFDWAQQQNVIICTYDEDFADQLLFSHPGHAGIIRLRVWPTTIEETQKALSRLFSQTQDEELIGALIIVNRKHIRIRAAHQNRKTPS